MASAGGWRGTNLANHNTPDHDQREGGDDNRPEPNRGQRAPTRTSALPTLCACGRNQSPPASTMAPPTASMTPAALLSASRTLEVPSPNTNTAATHNCATTSTAATGVHQVCRRYRTSDIDRSLKVMSASDSQTRMSNAPRARPKVSAHRTVWAETLLRSAQVIEVCAATSCVPFGFRSAGKDPANHRLAAKMSVLTPGHFRGGGPPRRGHRQSPRTAPVRPG